MNIHLVAIGSRMPEWVDNAYKEYAKRFPSHCCLKLIAVASKKRSKSVSVPHVVAQESRDLLNSVPKNSYRVALERTGCEHSTEQLASRMRQWLELGRDVAVLIGGPDGLSSECLAQTQEHWSLSKLTFAHPLVRVIVAEQLYRAWSIINNLPYHRADTN